MSITSSHSHSSTDLGESQPPERALNQNSRIHPPRLQHSPSLPNIWIPPHSGPIPPDMLKIEKQIVNHPSAPSSPKRESSNTERATRHVKYASVDPVTRNSLAPKTHARRRTDRDQPHKLLTPPLTPSSSIRTTDSREDGGALTVSGEIQDADSESTRILLLENVGNQIPISSLESTILEALAVAQAEKSLDPNPSMLIPSLKRNEIIRGTNDRLRSEGKVPVVFFDIRIARIAEDILSVNNSEHLQRYASDKVNDSGDPLAVSARLAPMEDVVEILGKSIFLDSIDGSFFIKVQRVNQSLTTDASPPPQLDTQNGETNASTEADESSFVLSGINISVLQNILKSYGSIRTLQYTGKEIDQNGLTSLIYRVEYHDSREAGFSYAELAGQALFGMKIFAFGKIIASDQVTKDRSALNAGPESPPVFYDSSSIVVSDDTIQPIYYQPYPSHQLDIPQPSAMVQTPSFPLQQWEDTAYRSNPISPCYTPDGICQYCPSRGGMNGADYHAATSQPHHYVPALTPTLYYPAHANAQTTPMSPGPSAYGFVDPQMLPLANVGPWGFDPAIAAIGQNINLSVPMPPVNSSSPLPQEVPHMGGGRPQPRHANFTNHHAMRHSAHPLETPRILTVSPKSHADMPTPSPPSSQSKGLAKYDSSPPQLTASNDRNQLNLARISDGADTRTTIMIKNIPNKMSDLDLTAYIGQVCPRKIDFLYLRMDFKNACNVGYAFVNFIDVQDLLHFATERLGVKWNLFKSDKVLQMSYANYQGKEALVEKFKNSSIMDEPEHWRPRIFYSSGPNQGLLEPFPAPTHIRRKERSSYNRGTLFPPGVNSLSSAQQPHGLLHNTNRRFHSDARPHEGRSGFTGGRPNHRSLNNRNGADEASPHRGGREGHDGAGLFRSSDH